MNQLTVAHRLHDSCEVSEGYGRLSVNLDVLNIQSVWITGRKNVSFSLLFSLYKAGSGFGKCLNQITDCRSKLQDTVFYVSIFIVFVTVISPIVEYTLGWGFSELQ